MNPLPDPVTKWLEGINALNLLLWVAAVWAAGALFVRTLKRSIPAIKNLIELSDSLQRLPDWMDSADERLDEIRHEMFPNGGGSMRDDLQTLSLQVEKLQAHQNNDYERLGELENTVTRRLELREQSLADNPETNPKEYL